jgi:hypothetical protein
MGEQHAQVRGWEEKDKIKLANALKTPASS